MTRQTKIITRSSSIKPYNVAIGKTQIKTYERELKDKTNEYDQHRDDVEKQNKEDEKKYENSKKRKIELTFDTNQRAEFMDNNGKKIQDTRSKLVHMEKTQKEAEEKQKSDICELNQLTRYIVEEYQNNKSKNIQKLASLKD